MNFKEELKNEIQNLSPSFPSEEQCERIRQGTMRKLSENIPEKKKKPPYMKIAAISGTAVCAAAVVLVIFGGFRGFHLMENAGTGDNLAINSSVNDYQSWGAANDPNYNNNTGAAGGAAPGSAQSPSVDGSSDADTVGKPNNEPAAPQPDNGSQLEETPNIPYLKFSEDKKVCEVTISGETVTYERVDVSVGGAGRDKPLISVRSEPYTELFVYFDNDTMEIYTKDGSFFGAYIK